MRVKADPFLFDLAKTRQRENLKSAAVGKNRSVPVHETVQSAEIPNQFVARPYMKMIGIGQDDLTAQICEVSGRKRPFDGCLRRDVHEYRRLYLSMRRLQGASAGLPFCFQQLKSRHSAACSCAIASLTIRLVPRRSAPRFRKSSASCRVEIPPAAFTFT